MAIEFVGGTIAGKAGSTSGFTQIRLDTGLTGGIRDHVEPGDLVIGVFASGSTTQRLLSINTFSNVASGYGNDDRDTNLQVGFKSMGATPDAAAFFGPTGSVDDAGVTAVYVFSGVALDSPLDVPAVPIAGSDTRRPTPFPITPVTPGAKIVAIGAGTTGGSASFSAPPALASFISLGSAGTTGVGLGIGQANWTGGQFAPGQFASGGTSTSDSWAAVTLALRPITINALPTSGTHEHTATSPVVTLIPNVTADPCAHAHEASSPSLITPVSPANAVHSQIASDPAVYSSAVTANDSAHGHVATSPTIAARNSIAPASAAHGHQVTAASVAAKWTLAVASGVHAHLAGSPMIVRTVITPASRRFVPPASRAVGRRFTPSVSRADGRRFTPEG